MRRHLRRFACRLILGIVLVAPLLQQGIPVTPAKEPGAKDAMQFAADMAERGNWREASFRWNQLVDRGIVDAKVNNNLGVAAEATGDLEQADRYYTEALRAAPGDPTIADNWNAFLRLRKLLQPDKSPDDGGADDTVTPTAGGAKVKGKVLQVNVSVPIPPRLDPDNFHTLLVASFLANESTLLDIDRELAKFLRTEFRRRTKLDVLDVVPPPAIPEQTLDDLIANSEFWKHLGREYGADLIVSGVVAFGRQEVSGFEDVDVINPATGQKVRDTQYVEQEEFSYTLDILFMDGATGSLLFRDRLTRKVRYRGLMNDDIVSVVATRMRVESRSIFKK